MPEIEKRKQFLKEQLGNASEEDGEVCVLADELLRLEQSLEVHRNNSCAGQLGPAEDRDPCAGVGLHHTSGLRTDERNDIGIAARKSDCCKNCFVSRPPPLIPLTHWAKPGCLPRKSYSKEGVKYAILFTFSQARRKHQSNYSHVPTLTDLDVYFHSL